MGGNRVQWLAVSLEGQCNSQRLARPRENRFLPKDLHFCWMQVSPHFAAANDLWLICDYSWSLAALHDVTLEFQVRWERLPLKDDLPLLRTGTLGLCRPQDGDEPASASQITRSCTCAKCKTMHQTQIVNDVLSDMLWLVHRPDSQTLSATSNISSQSVVQRLKHQQPMRRTQIRSH